MFAAVPVPQHTTRWSIAVTRCAISGLITCSHSGSCWYRTRWAFGASLGTFANSTRRTAHALQRLPSFASVANAAAMSIVGTSSTPSVIEGTGSRATVMPIRWATSTMCSGPTSSASCANTTFTESCVALHRSR